MSIIPYKRLLAVNFLLILVEVVRWGRATSTEINRKFTGGTIAVNSKNTGGITNSVA
jgi:hypothetical protein